VTAVSNLLDIVKHLSVAIGPRPPCSPEEEAAARYLDGYFKGLGLQSEVMSFRGVRTFSLTFALYYAMAAISPLLALLSPVVGSLVALLNFRFYLAEINTFPIYGKALSFWRGHNVIAKQTAGGEVKRSIVLTAHLDSSRSGMLFVPPLLVFFRSITLSGLAAIGSIPVILGARLLVDHVALWWLAVAMSASLLGGILLLVERETRGRYTHGANDNASAVAVLAGVAEHFAKNPLLETEIFFVGTGAEESGVFGMTDFLLKHKAELKNPIFINLESLGVGRLRYITKEGIFPSLDAPEELVTLAEKVANDKGLPFVRGRFHTILTDNVAVLTRNLPGITLMGASDKQLIPYWHQAGDTWDKISEDNLSASVEMAKELAVRIAS